MIRTWFGCFRAQKLHFGAFRQSLVLWSTLGFGQSRLWISGSTTPWCPEPHGRPAVLFTFGHLRGFLCHGRPVPTPTVDRSLYAYGSAPDSLVPRSTGTRTHGRPVPGHDRDNTEAAPRHQQPTVDFRIYARSTGASTACTGSSQSEPTVDRWLATVGKRKRTFDPSNKFIDPQGPSHFNSILISNI